MEPLGIIASVIAVFQASDRILGAVPRITQLRHALKEIGELQSSVLCLRRVLDDAQTKSCRNVNPDCPFCMLLNHCQHAVLELERLLVELHDPEKSTLSLARRQVIKLRWLKTQARAESLKQRVRDLISLLTLRISLHERNGCDANQPKGSTGPVILKEAPTDVAVAGLVENNFPLTESSTLPDPTTAIVLNTNTRHELWPKLPINKTHKEPIQPHYILPTMKACSTTCHCYCHQIFRWKVPIFHGRLGVFFCHRTGFVSQESSFMTTSCLKHDLFKCTILYIPPLWLSCLSICLNFAYPATLQISLSVLRFQRSDSAFSMAIRRGDCGQVQQLLSAGEGHIADVIFPYGMSVLQLAAQRNHHTLSQFLITQGAQYEPLYLQWTPSALLSYMTDYSLINHYLSADELLSDLTNYLAPSAAANALQCSYELVRLEGSSFTRIHKAVLGISTELLADICKEQSEDVNAKDSNGRTPLFWAAKKGFNQAVQCLLQHGANTDTADLHGCTPIHVAAGMGFAECVITLAKNGANLNDVDRMGASPLHYASAGGHSRTVECLIDLGADMTQRNFFSEPPMSYAIYARRQAVVKLFVDRGMTNDHCDAWGFTPLLDTVFLSAHEVFLTFSQLDPALFASRLFDGQSILHIAARNSDKLMLERLMVANLAAVDTQALDASGSTAMECMMQRRDASNLVPIFGSLLLQIEASQRKLADEKCQTDNTS